MESESHDLQGDQVKHQGDHRVEDRKAHFIDALKDRVCDRGHGVEYHRKGTVNRHPDRQGIIPGEQKVVYRSRKHRESHRRRDRNDTGEPDRGCHALSHKFLISHSHRPGYGRDQRGRKGI